MNIIQDQLIVILAPFIDYEIFANVRQINDDSLILVVKTNSELPIDKEVLCIAVDSENMFEFYTQVIARDGDLLFIKKPVYNELNVIEKRKFNRVDCNIGFMATPVSINNIPIPSSDKKFRGIIKNLSGGGVMIETNLNLPVSMTFSFKLKLNFFMECQACVVRTQNVDKDVYQSGCQFVGNNLEMVKTISLYTFRERLKQKRQELNQRKMQKGGKVVES